MIIRDYEILKTRIHRISQIRVRTRIYNVIIEVINGRVKDEVSNDQNIKCEVADYFMLFNEEQHAYSLNI